MGRLFSAFRVYLCFDCEFSTALRLNFTEEKVGLMKTEKGERFVTLSARVCYSNRTIWTPVACRQMLQMIPTLS